MALLVELGWSDRWNPLDLERDLVDDHAAQMISYPWVAPAALDQTETALASMARRILTATESVTMSEVQTAIRRRVRVNRMPFVPPTHAVRAYFEQHPSFDVEAENLRSVVPLDATVELGETDLFLVQHLTATDQVSLTRAALTAAAAAALVVLDTSGSI